MADSAAVDRLARHPRRLGRVLGNLANGRIHLLRARGQRLQVGVDLAAGFGNHLRLRRRLFGIGRDLLAGGGKLFARRCHLFRRAPHGLDHLMQARLHLVDRPGQIAQFIVALNFQFLASQVPGGNGLRPGQDGLGGGGDSAAQKDRHKNADAQGR